MGYVHASEGEKNLSHHFVLHSDLLCSFRMEMHRNRVSAEPLCQCEHPAGVSTESLCVFIYSSAAKSG